MTVGGQDDLQVGGTQKENGDTMVAQWVGVSLSERKMVTQKSRCGSHMGTIGWGFTIGQVQGSGRYYLQKSRKILV